MRNEKIDEIRIETYNIEDKELKKKKRKKKIIIAIIVILLIICMYISTVIVKRINISKLGDIYCEYNGEHPIETGMKGETRSMCRGCSKIMKFERTITNELCDTCAKEFHRCKLCGNKLLEEGR